MKDLNAMKRERVIHEVELDAAALVGHALLRRLILPEGKIREGLPEDLAQAAGLAREVLGQARRMGQLLHYSRHHGGAPRLLELRSRTLEEYVRGYPEGDERERAKAELSRALEGLAVLAGRASTPELRHPLPEKTAPEVEKREPHPSQLPFENGVAALLAMERIPAAEHAAILDFVRFVGSRFRIGRLELLGRRHFEEFLEERVRVAGDSERLGDFVRPLEAFAAAIGRSDVLRSTRTRIAEKTEDRLGKEMGRLFERAPGLLPYRDRIAEFLRHVEKRMGVRSVDALTEKHFRAYVDFAFERGDPAREIGAAQVGLGAFARVQRKWHEFVPVAQRLSFVPEIFEKGGCWIAKAESAKEVRLLQAGFARHSLRPGPLSCGRGGPPRGLRISWSCRARGGRPS